MAITKTGAIYKSLSFDNTSSRSYGVYITGEAVYNAPERAVEMISIPGRNGAFALDQGRFENIEVSYPAGIFADNEADFVQAVSDFRNFLCSKKGYCRLTDEYNPNEYRMAVYKSGLEVDPAQLRAGEFTITFECKPQRWLTSGETATAVASGGTVTNPTLFESKPLLEVKGYGKISINGQTIERYGLPLGLITLVSDGTLETTSFAVPSKYVNAGDEITISGMELVFKCETGTDYFSGTPTMTVTNSYSGAETEWVIPPYDDASTYRNHFVIRTKMPTLTFTAGTSQTIANDTSVTGAVQNNTYTISVLCHAQVTYNASTGLISFGTSGSGTTTHQGASVVAYLNSSASKHGVITANSSVLYTTDTTYIDLDIGECYVLDNNVATSVNDLVSLPTELITLVPGTNTIVFDNTFTKVDIVPRWWKI